jgi:hypothetical protein
VLREAADITGAAARYAHLEDHLDFAKRLELVKGKFLYFKRTDYTKRLIDAEVYPPAHFKNPQVHHDLSQAEDLIQKFYAVGLDIDAPAFTRWVEGNKRPAQLPNVPKHQNWSGKFNAEWRDWFSKPENENPTQQDVLDQMNRLRSKPEYQPPPAA